MEPLPPPPLLRVEDLKLHYFTSQGVVKALDGLSFEVFPGETLGIVGESGCGKTTTGSALLNMPSPPGRIVSGHIWIDGLDVTTLNDRDLRRRVRWVKISMVFQGAMNCLTPVYTIREQMLETYREHHSPFNATEAEERMGRYLGHVGLPLHILDRYPHELSGGMKQRVVIAMALFLEPSLVILDEPTTALDVIVQAQILNLLKELKQKLGLSYLFITHDLATEAEIADRVMVMYAGQAVEVVPNEGMFGPDGPSHPYSQKLLAATPRLHHKVDELAFIPGSPPDLAADLPGCRFAPRCPFAKTPCLTRRPELTSLKAGHLVACWKAVKDPDYEQA